MLNAQCSNQNYTFNWICVSGILYLTSSYYCTYECFYDFDKFLIGNFEPCSIWIAFNCCRTPIKHAHCHSKVSVQLWTYLQIFIQKKMRLLFPKRQSFPHINFWQLDYYFCSAFIMEAELLYLNHWSSNSWQIKTINVNVSVDSMKNAFLSEYSKGKPLQLVHYYMYTDLGIFVVSLYQNDIDNNVMSHESTNNNTKLHNFAPLKNIYKSVAKS